MLPPPPSDPPAASRDRREHQPCPHGLPRPGKTPSGAEIRIRLLMQTSYCLNQIQTLPWEDVDLHSTELRLRDSKMSARKVPLSRAAASRPASPSPSSLWRWPARRWILITSVLNLHVTAFNPSTATRYGPDHARFPASRRTMMKALQGDCSCPRQVHVAQGSKV